jgi:hypothetical protein
MNKVAAIIAGAALGLGGAAGAIAVLKDHPAGGAPRAVWTEVAWPFPTDQWGRGKAFRCKLADCGAEVNLYLRAKIGFCNCLTGISDDAELDRMGDFDLVGAATPLGAGRHIEVGRMQGRSRAYALHQADKIAGKTATKTAISVAFNDRCDMVVATAVVPHDRPTAMEPDVIAFLNSRTVVHWAETTLGL